MRAALAQSVERRLGKAEVGGSSPLGSLYKSTAILVNTGVADFLCPKQAEIG